MRIIENDIPQFSQKVQEELGYYVYCLVDPRDKRVFYVGKGVGNRVFAHANDALELEDFEKYLVVLDEPYKKLERNSYRHEEFIPDDKDNRALAERLKRVQYLTSIEYEKQFYRNSKSEVPVIRCRVKAKQAS